MLRKNCQLISSVILQNIDKNGQHSVKIDKEVLVFLDSKMNEAANPI